MAAPRDLVVPQWLHDLIELKLVPGETVDQYASATLGMQVHLVPIAEGWTYPEPVGDDDLDADDKNFLNVTEDGWDLTPGQDPYYRGLP